MLLRGWTSAGYQFGTLNREAKLGKINFTGNLVVDYRRPLPKNGTYLVRLWIEKIVDGRKGSIFPIYSAGSHERCTPLFLLVTSARLLGYLKGQLEDRAGKIYVESTSLYVVPRCALFTSRTLH